MAFSGRDGAVITDGLFLLSLGGELGFVEEFHFCAVQTLVEGVLDGLALLEPPVCVAEAIPLLLFPLSTQLLLILQLAQQLLQLTHLLQLPLPTAPAIHVLIMQLRNLPPEGLVLSRQVPNFGIELIYLSLQVQVFLLGLDVLMDIYVLKPAEGTVNGGLAGVEGIGPDALGSWRTTRLFLFGLAGLVLGGGGGRVVPLELPHCLQELRIESAHIRITVALGEMLDIPPYFFQSDAYFFGDVDYQLLPHVQQLPVLTHCFLLKVLVPLLNCLLEDQERVGHAWMCLQQQVQYCVHAREVFLVFVEGGMEVRSVFEVVELLGEGQGGCMLPACVQQHLSGCSEILLLGPPQTIASPSSSTYSHPLHPYTLIK